MMLYNSIFRGPEDGTGSAPSSEEGVKIEGEIKGAASSAPEQEDKLLGDVPEGNGADFDFPDELDGASRQVPDAGPKAADRSGSDGRETPAKPVEEPKPETLTVEGAPQPAAPSPEENKGKDQPVTPAAGKESAGQDKSLVEMIDEGQHRIAEALVQSTFKLSQEDSDALESGDTAAVIPKLMARTYLQAVRATAEMVEQAIPNMVMQALSARQAQSNTEDEFFGTYKELTPHKERVREVAKMLRGQFPTLPKAEFLPKLVTATRAVLAAEGVTLSAPQVVQGQVVPVVNGKGNGERVSPVPSGFAPAVRSVPGVPHPAVIDPNDWGTINEYFDKDFTE